MYQLLLGCLLNYQPYQAITSVKSPLQQSIRGKLVVLWSQSNPATVALTSEETVGKKVSNLLEQLSLGDENAVRSTSSIASHHLTAEKFYGLHALNSGTTPAFSDAFTEALKPAPDWRKMKAIALELIHAEWPNKPEYNGRVEEKGMPPASTRSSKSVIGSTIAAALLTLILFGVLNASFVVIKFGFEVDDHGDLHYDDNGLLGAYTTSIQFTILIAMIACFLTFMAERSRNSKTKAHIRNSVGVLWAINIGLSAFSLGVPGVRLIKGWSNNDGGSLSASLALVFYIVLTIMFLFCIFMTALCYGSKYSRCYCCTSTTTQTVFYVTGGGNATQVVMVPEQPSY